MYVEVICQRHGGFREVWEKVRVWSTGYEWSYVLTARHVR